MANNVEMLVNALSRSGYRVTQPRRAVIEALCRARRSLDPETLCIRARNLHSAVGLATVYRTLDMLQALGHCSRVQIGSKGYALTCGQSKMHVHLVCSHCMGVIELEADDAMASLKRKLDSAGFKAQANAVELVGLCAKCQ
jgi:Fe2+ or Zn2+ uptake regulation protein